MKFKTKHKLYIGEDVPICNKCGYEINGATNDYAPVCNPTSEISQCNECIECLLYCTCEGE